MRLLKNIKCRLASASGETLVETLVSILISTLALIMLAGAIGTAVNIVSSSKERMEDFYKGQGNMIASASTGTANIDLKVKLRKSDTSSSKSVDVYASTDGSGVVMYKEAS